MIVFISSILMTIMFINKRKWHWRMITMKLLLATVVVGLLINVIWLFGVEAHKVRCSNPSPLHIRALSLKFLFEFLLDFFHVEERRERRDKVWGWSARFLYGQFFRSDQKKKSAVGTHCAHKQRPAGTCNALTC